MGHNDDAGAGVGQLGDHGEGRADAAVIGDGGPVERHVQVATDQDVPPADTNGEQFVESVRSHGSKPSR
ncbi:hypothetical protein GCM10023081_28270 [Arthrobacter ginkgonis]|uniref:Uncharacterized protein n=1 Tax=Arthrobacter ginkgonis TaxID=1630594 RepID=A0ABP7CEZ2_9MICC